MSDNRTLGTTRDCRGCRFWSEMLAEWCDGGPLEAYCLNMESPKGGTYTTGYDSCQEWRSGHHGAVDEPPDYGEEVCKLYRAEEEQTEDTP